MDFTLGSVVPLAMFWKRVTNCSCWIMETLSRTKAETFVAFLATTIFCQQNKSASSSNIFHSQFADWGLGGTFGIRRCCLGGPALHKQEEGNKLDKTNA